jgi:tetratricopeptide (TPR) repeat protein
MGLAAAFACVAIVGCQQRAQPQPAASMDLPMTTQSQPAREAFLAGLEALDMQDGLGAHRHFKAAVQADENFALAHMYAALSSASTEEFVAGLGAAERHAQGASRAEQLFIQGWRHNLNGDLEAQLTTTRTLTELHPQSARAWLAHAGVLQALNRIPEARAAFDRALAIAPELPAAHMLAGGDYLGSEPKDFARAAGYFETAVRLAPNQSAPYDLLGDAHRAQNRLEDALQDYTNAAQRAPDQGAPVQQRAHVHSFLGNYAEARADYDRAFQLEAARGGNAGYFLGLFRAYVNLYEGQPGAAVNELRSFIARVDASNVEGKPDLKAAALTNIAQVATHNGDYATAENAIRDLDAVTSAQASAIGDAELQRALAANVIFLRGMLAARRGDANGVRTLASQFETTVAADTNPRKLERMRQFLGMAAYQRRDYAGAEASLAQANPNDPYVRYYLALSQMQTGKADRARQTFSELAVYNFNLPTYAMVRRDVLDRVATAS